jgi:transcriptional regulator with XRE-family HTH domain
MSWLGSTGPRIMAFMDRGLLADFLRNRRESLQPEDVGLPRGARRRTHGLRREEVAQLASMSSDYYARLEQARGPLPSPLMVAAIGRALRLTLTERDHLYQLAGHTPPHNEVRSDLVPRGIRRVLDRLDTPAMVTNDLGEVLAQNSLAVALLGDESRFGPEDPNRSRFYRWFTDEGERRKHPVEQHGDYSRSYVAVLHLAAGRRSDDPRGRALIERLLAASPEFASLWADYEVTWTPGPDRKTFLHPEVGSMELDCDTLAAENDSQILLIYSAAPGSESAERLRLLSVVGNQTFADANDVR